MRSWPVPLPRFAAIFAAMEISLLFDNAVVNTSRQKSWEPFRKKLFLRVGNIIAV
jgi:hypothetical protein